MSPTPERAASSLAQRVLFAALLVTSLAIAAYAFLFQAGVPLNPDIQSRFAEIPLYAAFHVLGSAVALLIGGFQFMPRIRTRHIRWHRWLGRTYLLAVLFGGIGGLVLAGRADGGLTGKAGFALLGVIWLASGWQAYRAIRRGDVAAHRIWMIRNFALTFAAVTLRIHLGVFTGALSLPLAQVYPLVAWLCWVPNLIVAEWFIVRPTGAAGRKAVRSGQVESGGLNPETARPSG